MFLKSQKNLLHTAIREHGFNLRDFRLVEANKLDIIHIQSGYHFLINPYEITSGGSSNKELRLQSVYTPAFKEPIPTQKEVQFPGAKAWTDVLAYFNQWLTWLKSEAEQPDLWAEMEHEPSLFEDAEIITEERFTDAEIKLLEARVPEIEQEIVNLNLPPDAQAAITAIVRKVPAKAARFTKKELSDALVGSFVKVGFKWQMTTADISEVWIVSQRFFTLALP